ncbi:CMRF35-like molecule 5 [Pteronotus mesoamericanus]|uniref:CMRF35-like molecule 5 n=1 Tax=Pteronotus mesoamericanus TaxID=1884717 RepID=UPI0023ECA4D0|nr:CMRF35-like molecule 5 [Pteronotus parnellii mesoamericanus]
MWLLPPLLLLIISGSSAGITGPEEVRGPEGGSLTVQCYYDPGWETYVKYWCRGADWSSCKTLVRTAGSEWEVKEDRAFIRDNQTSCAFTVTMEKLRREDTDTYWCAIEKTGADLNVPVRVTVGPVIAQCHYGPQWETHVEQWCGGADGSGCSVLVQSPGSEQKGRKSAVYISQERRSFTVALHD